MNEYQAIYDAVRSRISGGNIGSIVAEIARNAFDFGHVTVRAQEQVYYIANEMVRPSVLFRPSCVPDGNKWSALYGENLMEGVCGFGDTPEKAMRDFDNNWWKQKTPTAVLAAPAEPEPEDGG